MPDVVTPTAIGSRFRTIQSQISPVPFDSGNTRSVELPRSFIYKKIRCRLRGSIASAAGTAGPIGENPLGLIKRIDLIADGRKILVSVSGAELFRLSNIFNSKHGERLPSGVGAGTFDIRACFDIHLEAAGMLTPIMSYFDPRPYEKVELRVQWGTVADIFSTPSTAAVNAETALDLQLVQSAEGAEQIGFNRLMFTDEQSFAGAPFNNFAINVPRAGLLAGILVRTYTTTAPEVTDGLYQNTAAGSANAFGSLTLKSDNNFLHLDGLNPTTLQASNVGDYRLDMPPTTVTAPVPMPRVTGYYFLDLTEDGLATSLLNTYDLNVLQLICSSWPTLATAITQRTTWIFYEPITAS